jgi:hypothetical protein
MGFQHKIEFFPRSSGRIWFSDLKEIMAVARRIAGVLITQEQIDAGTFAGVGRLTATGKTHAYQERPVSSREPLIVALCGVGTSAETALEPGVVTCLNCLKDIRALNLDAEPEPPEEDALVVPEGRQTPSDDKTAAAEALNALLNVQVKQVTRERDEAVAALKEGLANWRSRCAAMDRKTSSLEENNRVLAAELAAFKGTLESLDSDSSGATALPRNRQLQYARRGLQRANAAARVWRGLAAALVWQYGGSGQVKTVQFSPLEQAGIQHGAVEVTYEFAGDGSMTLTASVPAVSSGRDT